MQSGLEKEEGSDGEGRKGGNFEEPFFAKETETERDMETRRDHYFPFHLAAVARRRMGSGGRRRSRQLNLPRNFNGGASPAVSPASTPYYYNPVTTHGGWEHDGGWQRSGQSK